MNFYTFKEEFFNYLQELYALYINNKYFKHFSLIVLLAACLGLLFTGYTLFKKRKLELASASLMECIITFNQKAEETAPNWDELIAKCKELKNDHHASDLAPYFDLLCSNALLKKGLPDEALTAMEQAANNAPYNDLGILVKTKYALMLLESNDQSISAKGLEKLTALSADTKNKMRDLALYQLGRYFFAVDDFQKAKDTWSQLVSMNTIVNGAPSPWVALGQQKLNQLL
ncbi:hypothetical protein EKK58_04840 [Candidatus Dependentiae bacterium]|nr:MAG: hypothetical protein EKK58_04840 [Candidatus Dependentiae bacterium]